MQARKLALLDVNGKIVREVDISDIPHANAQADMHVAILTQCDMGHWHLDQKLLLPPFGNAITGPFSRVDV